MIHDKDFTGRIEFKYYLTKESGSHNESSWTKVNFEGGIEVTVPEQIILDVYGQPYKIPEHTELIPFTEKENQQLKFTFDRIKKRIKQELNK